MVPRVHINLHAAGMNHLQLVQFGLILLIVGALSLAAFFWWTGSRLNQEIDAIQSEVMAINTANTTMVTEGQSVGLDLSNTGIQALPQKVSFVKEIRERVKFSWTQLLTDLESTLPQNTRMRSVSLDEKQNTILLHGSAKSLPDLNTFIHQLENFPAFQDVILSQHATKTQKNKKGKSVVVFSMKASYYPKYTLIPPK